MRMFLAALFFGILAAVPAVLAVGQGQTWIRIKRIDTSDFPLVRLAVSVTNGNADAREFSASNFELFENGVAQRLETVICPGDSALRFSVAVLLDRSSSMARNEFGESDPDSLKLRAAKSGAEALLSLLGPRDEAGLYSFASDYGSADAFTEHRPFTTDKEDLIGSVQSIRAEGGTWLWQALLRAIDSLQPRKGRPILVCLTDGRSQGENPAFHSAEAVIKAAMQAHVPVYFIGLGNDVDESVLAGISSATGGKYFRSPTPDDLLNAFRRLGEEVLVDACALRYTSSNPCYDGSLRLLELAHRSPGSFAETDTFYTVSYHDQTTLLYFEFGLEAPSKGLLRVPVFVGRALSTAMPLSCDIGVKYDPGLLRFVAIRTDNSVSAGAALFVEESSGRCRVRMESHVPGTGVGPLFSFEFETSGVPEDKTTVLSFESATLEQHCLIGAPGSDMDLLLRACRETRKLEGEALRHDDALLRVPIRLLPAIEAGTALQFHLGIGFDTTLLDYAGCETAGTLAAFCAPVLTRVKNSLTISMTGISCGARDALVLKFRPRSGRAGGITKLRISDPMLETSCVNDLGVLDIPVPLNGYCEPLLSRAAGFRLRNHPNPFSDATAFTFTLLSAARVKLRVLDGNGREVYRVLDGNLPAGEHEVNAGDMKLTAGVYLAVLSCLDRSETAAFLVLR